tara:strand:- start:357 stop:767 length:411 start_codon:yes stop_codon:yes gene_type:complete
MSEINIGNGIKRFFLVSSFLWFLFFLIASYANLSPTTERYTLGLEKCEVYEKDLISDSQITNSKREVVKNRIKRLEKEGRLISLSSTYEGNCDGIFKLSMNERINYDVKSFFIIGLTSIPFYFLVLFIINGFYKKK